MAKTSFQQNVLTKSRVAARRIQDGGAENPTEPFTSLLLEPHTEHPWWHIFLVRVEHNRSAFLIPLEPRKRVSH